MARFISRICWNSKGWQYPTGEAGDTETGTNYVHKAGFGHEEWLFDFTKLIDGFHYGFLQPVNRSRRIEGGESHEFLLYTVDHQRRRLYIGEIERCHILTAEERKAAMVRYEKKGWLRDMRTEVKAIGGDAKRIQKGSSDYNTGIFNIRFRPEDAAIFDEPRVAKPNDGIMKRSRYQLYEGSDVITAEFRARRRGTKNPLAAESVSRRAVGSVTIERRHRELQNQILTLLRKRFGRECVWLEQDDVDVKVTTHKIKAFIEVKTCTTAMSALREALGQILSYDFKDRSTKRMLIVASPALLDPSSKRFLEHLRKQYGLPLYYWQVSTDMENVPDFSRNTNGELVTQTSDKPIRKRKSKSPGKVKDHA